MGKVGRQGFEGAKNTPGNLELALGKLVDLVRARRTESRLPPEEQLIDAFRFLFASRLESQRGLTRNEIFLATETLKHFEERGLVLASGGTPSLSKDDLHDVLGALAQVSGRDKFRTDTRILASMIFQDLHGDAQGPPGSTKTSSASEQYLPTYIAVLSKTGSAREARDLLLNSSFAHAESSLPMWMSVLKGLATESLQKEFWATMTELKNSAGILEQNLLEELTVYLAENDNVQDTKKICNENISQASNLSTRCLTAVVDFCIRNEQFEWGAPILEALQSKSDASDIGSTIIMWYAAQESDVSKVQRKLGQLLEEGVVHDFDMNLFNRIIAYAFSKGNAPASAAYLEVAKTMGLRPDGKTYLLQLQHALTSGDMAEAKRFYELMISEDVPVDGSDVLVLNKFVATLSFAPGNNYELIMRAVDTLLERGADLEAETLAGLCHVFLQKDELEEATGLLRHRVDSYPMGDRARVSAVFRQFISDPLVQDQRAFDAYELFRHAFPETPVELRLPLMQSFFDRNRSDLACLVFGHMRQREDLEARPTTEAYAQCFEGIAKCRDVDGLQMVYNMLKLDLEVEQTTRIHNGLMAAYTACQQPFTSIIDHFWKIMDSKEGPTLSSFALALRACETWIPQGAQEARRIMAMMQAWDLVITKELYDCYIGALAGQSEFENVIELIEEMDNDIGERPDVITIGTFYNAIPWQYRKDEVEKWAKAAYPELWDELVSYGEEIDEEWEIRYFKIDRSIDIEDEPLFNEGQYDPQLAKQSQISLEAPPK